MERFRLKMTKTSRGKDDDHGAPIETYEKGEVYEVGRGLYRAFVKELKVARALDEDDEDDEDDEEVDDEPTGPAGRETKVVEPPHTPGRNTAIIKRPKKT